MVQRGICLGSIALVALTACGQPEISEPAGFPGVMPGATWSAEDSWAARVDASHSVLFITTMGSSSCPHVIDTVEQDANTSDQQQLTVTLRQETTESGACTADLSPHTSFARLTDPVDAQEPVDIHAPDLPGSITVTPDPPETIDDDAAL